MKFKVIIALVTDDRTDTIIDVARKDGATGCTVVTNARGEGLAFQLKDFDGSAKVPVVYKGSVPDLFETGRHVYLRGELADGVFVAVPDSLVTKCPSKYAPKNDSQPA